MSGCMCLATRVHLWCVNIAREVEGMLIFKSDCKPAACYEYNLAERLSSSAMKLCVYVRVCLKAFFCPVDTALTTSQANKLIRELSPAHLVIPHQYTSPPLLLPSRQDLVIEYVSFVIFRSFFIVSQFRVLRLLLYRHLVKIEWAYFVSRQFVHCIMISFSFYRFSFSLSRQFSCNRRTHCFIHCRTTLQ